jgi:predicted HTH transcriptional regulator
MHGEALPFSISELISQTAEETLHLEFKTLADSSGDRIAKDDRRLLAKAVCGMANAEGGTIIIGIETKRVDNVDVAVAAKPIGNAERLRNLLMAAIPEMLSPQHTGIEVQRGT